jgi:6-phosphogluconolactonase
VFPDAEAVARHAADAIAGRIGDARRDGRALHIALAGGTTPQRAYELLADIEGSWKHVHLWLGDERCVPEDDPQSNASMVRESLYANARAEPPLLHAVASPEIPEDAAWLYGLQVHEHVPDLVFDIVLLGMGPDGHTASLFPGARTLDERRRWVVPATAPATSAVPRRLTFTLPLINAARAVMFVAGGADKATVIRAIRAGSRDLPAGRVRARSTLWLLDALAAGVAAPG